MFWWCWRLEVVWCLHSAFVKNCYEKKEPWFIPWWWTRHITKFFGSWNKNSASFIVFFPTVENCFLKWKKKPLPKGNLLSIIFNNNTIKISYSCRRNMKSIISSHNRQILTPKNKQAECNCSVKKSGTIDNKLTSQTILTMSIS